MSGDFWIVFGRKIFIVLGLTYFTAAIATLSFITIVPSLIITGLYAFTELARIYNVNSTNTMMRSRKKKQVQFSWLI